MAEDLNTQRLPSPERISELIDQELTDGRPNPLTFDEKRQLLRRAAKMRTGEQSDSHSQPSLNPEEDAQILADTEKQLNQPTSEPKIQTSTNLDQPEPSLTTHFGNMLTEAGRRLQMVDRYYEQVLLQLSEDQSAIAGADQINQRNGLYRLEYFKTIHDDGQKLTVRFGQTPSLKGLKNQALTLIYDVNTPTPGFFERYQIIIDPESILIENSQQRFDSQFNPTPPPADTQPRPSNKVEIDSSTEQLTHKQQFYLHMFEKAAKLYLKQASKVPF